MGKITESVDRIEDLVELAFLLACNAYEKPQERAKLKSEALLIGGEVEVLAKFVQEDAPDLYKNMIAGMVAQARLDIQSVVEDTPNNAMSFRLGRYVSDPKKAE